MDSDESDNDGEEEDQSDEDDKEVGDEYPVENTVVEKVSEENSPADVKKRKYKMVNLKRKEKVRKLRDQDPDCNYKQPML